MFCKKCGKELDNEAVVCVHCGVAIAQKSSKQRAVYVLLDVLLGNFGGHNFYAGYIGRAVIQLVAGVFSAMLAGAMFAELETEDATEDTFILLGLSVVVCLGVRVWSLVEAFVVTNDSTGKKFG